MVVIIPDSPTADAWNVERTDDKQKPPACACTGDLICWPCWLKIRPPECGCPPGSRSTCSFCREYLPPPTPQRGL